MRASSKTHFIAISISLALGLPAFAAEQPASSAVKPLQATPTTTVPLNPNAKLPAVQSSKPLQNQTQKPAAGMSNALPAVQAPGTTNALPAVQTPARSAPIQEGSQLHKPGPGPALNNVTPLPKAPAAVPASPGAKQPASPAASTTVRAASTGHPATTGGGFGKPAAGGSATGGMKTFPDGAPTGGFTGAKDSKTPGAATTDPFIRDASGNPVGGSTGTGRDTGPKYDAVKGVFVFGDGTRVRGTDPAGNLGKVNDKGDIVYSDGTLVTHDPTTGDTTIIRPDGHTSSFGGPARGANEGPFFDAKTGDFVYSDGMRVRGSDPSGMRGKVGDKGEIQYSDGTSVFHDPASGRTEVRHADGSATIHDAQGGRLHTGPGMMTSTSAGGGTTVHDPKTGVTATFGGGSASYMPSGDKGDDNSGSGGSGDNNSSGSGSGSSSSSDSSSSSSNDEKDTSGDSGGKDEGSSSGDSADSDSGSKDTGGSEGQDGKEEGGGDKYQGGGFAGSGRGSAPRAGAVLDDFIARAKGERRDPERGAPGDCQPAGSGMPGGTTQPVQGEGATPCPPSDKGISTEDETRPRILLGDAPRNSGAAIGSGVVDPDRHGDSGAVWSRTFDPFDRNPVINPGAPR